ncbi:ABC transporter substrate-binding protein [Streptomyces sp. 5-6(2022)]|uniref:ABC transporter substrate-binding protein n=1 Tax=Streptomyces sp. 5-6(2022) TaxID=2936510 RepID=UPI0023B92BA8|nr:ABC transporter substrate-binding protein [Streptomyces sp. 5-6(2022)]
MSAAPPNPQGSQPSRRIFVKGAGGALLAGAALPALTACGGGSGKTSGGKTTITFASAKFFAKKSMKQIVDAYNASQSKVHVNYRELPTPSQSTEVHQQLVQSLSRRDASLDVFTQDIVWISEFAGAGWAAPMDGYVDSAERAKYFPGAIDACTYDDKLVALPWYLDSGMLYYRKDLLDDAGIDVPTTWDELRTAAKKLMDGNKVASGFNWQAKQAEVLVCDLVEFVGSNGGSILGPDGKKVTIADPKTVEAVQFMADTFGRYHITPKDVLSWDEEPSRMPFTGGQAAFLRNWSYVWGIAQDKSTSKVAGKVGTAKLPAFPGGRSTACLGGYQFGLNAASKNKSAAMDFLTWMSSPKTQLEFATGLGLAPSRPAVFDDPKLAKANPFMVTLKDIFTGGTPRPKTPKYPKVSLALQTTVSAALTSGDVAKNLSSAKSQIEQILGS